MQKNLSWFFYLCAIEGAVAMAALLLIPSEGGNLSPTRLALIGILLASCIVWAYFGIRSPGEVQRLARPGFILLAALLSLTFGLLLFLLRYLDPERFVSVYERLSPLLWYFLILSVQAAFLLLYLYKGFHPRNLSAKKPIYLSALAAFCFLLFIFIFISLTRLGLTPDPAYWGEPGVPILGWGFALALIGCAGIFCISFFLRSRSLDIFLPLAIYLLAVLLWLSVPVSVLSNSFYMPISPPAFEPFPYSDAAYYDQMAHSLLIGYPYLGEIPTRPLYIVFLTVLHVLFGEDYRGILAGQTFVLAIIPVVLYFLGKKLHSRAAGLTVALFFIFRELTTLSISSDTRVSNTKTLLVDLPTLLFLLLACLFAVRWLESKSQKDALLAGGTFGLLLLLRTQSMLLLPLIILAALLVLGRRRKASYALVSIFLLALIITILPWLLHNYLQTGQVAFDAPFQYRVIASQYAYSGNLDIQNYDFEGKGLAQVLLEFTLKDPKFVFGFITNHFLAAQVGGLLALPLIESYHGFFEPVNLYWMDWAGQLEWYNAALLILYLAVIALGLGAAWRRWQWIGVFPLALSLGYALATAVGRFSGWRYDLPADWIWYFYFGIGFAELLRHAALVFGSDREVASPPGTQSGGLTVQPLSARTGLPLLLLFVLISASPWLIKNISAPRYTEQSPAALEQEIVSLSGAPAAEEIQVFAAQSEAFLQEGRVLYPRSFSRDKGLASTNPWPAYAVRDYPRLGFLLLNQRSISAVFPGRPESMPFPHAEDAVVFGCQREDYVEVRLVAFPELDTVYLSAPLTETCSS
ncbi:MAG TPA: glycosyltransferase family 39 protein [Anaerolineales bacterium]|nr:glycosyltransferase family 39 protein [Anaerolineales bacterium]